MSAARIAGSRTRISRSNSVARKMKSESCRAAAALAVNILEPRSALKRERNLESSIYKYPDLGICLSVKTGITIAGSIYLNLQLRAPLRRQSSQRQGFIYQKTCTNTFSLSLSAGIFVENPIIIIRTYQFYSTLLTWRRGYVCSTTRSLSLSSINRDLPHRSSIRPARNPLYPIRHSRRPTSDLWYTGTRTKRIFDAGIPIHRNLVSGFSLLITKAERAPKRGWCHCCGCGSRRP